MANKDTKEFVANLPDEDKAELIGELLKGADVDAKVLVDDDDTVLISLDRYEELLMKETVLDIMVAAEQSEPNSLLPSMVIDLLVKRDTEK